MEEQNAGKAPDNRTVMGALAYLGPLVIISYLVGREDSFVKFHIKQGLVLFVIEVALWYFSSLLWGILLLGQIINIAILVLVVLGIMNVVGGKERELPVVGMFAKYFPI